VFTLSEAKGSVEPKTTYYILQGDDVMR